MSLDLINHKLTTSTTDKNGITTWRNPIVNVSIDSMGRVFKQGKVYKGNFDSSNVQVKYRTTIVDGGNKLYTNVSFNSLFARIVLGEKLGARTIRLKDEKKGYKESNIIILSNRKGITKQVTNTKQPLVDTQEDDTVVLDLSKLGKEDATHYNTKNTQLYLNRGNCWFYYSEASGEWCKSGNKESWILETTQPIEEKAKPKQTTLTVNTPEIEMKPNSNKQYYTLYEAKNEHTTEDGAIFPTLELAEWHQEKVSKGKGNAQVVLDYNGGYVLAEQIYLQEVVYNKAKPYTNFIDVLNNNHGIVSVVQDEHCKFDKLDNEQGFRSEICFMTLRKQLPEQVSKHQAQKIQGALERYSVSVKALDESIVGLEALLTQVK